LTAGESAASALRDLRFLREQAHGGMGHTPKSSQDKDFRDCGESGK
jgi:hypothetical protein